MKVKKLIPFYLMSILMFSSTATVFADTTTVTPTPVVISQDSQNNITPYADITGWKYKTINGYLHKRLYNYTKNEWIGGWIRC